MAFYSLLKIPCNQEFGVFLSVTKTKTDHPEPEEFALKIFFKFPPTELLLCPTAWPLFILSHPSRHGPLVAPWSLETVS